MTRERLVELVSRYPSLRINNDLIEVLTEKNGKMYIACASVNTILDNQTVSDDIYEEMIDNLLYAIAKTPEYAF